MPTQRRPTEPEYVNWAKTTLGINFHDEQLANRYKMNLASAKQFIQESIAWSELQKLLAQEQVTYSARHGTPLYTVESFDLHRKSFESFVNKTFRLNVVWNKNWPEPPRTGWIVEANLYNIVDDHLRMTIACTYLDGPDTVGDAIKKAAQQSGISHVSKKLGLDVGYYAHHHYLEFPVDLAMGPNVVSGKMKIELQVTTQAQT
jgi:ppGpp synthetase/RelA/SpoT-type nucleotidyltranferase